METMMKHYLNHCFLEHPVYPIAQKVGKFMNFMKVK